MKARSPSFVRQPEQRALNRQMQIFAVGLGGGVAGVNGGNVYTMWKVSLDPDAAWSDVVNLGNAGIQLNEVFIISIGYLPDYRMQLFVSDGQKVCSIYKLTTDPDSAWSNWTSLGNPTQPAVGILGPSVGYLPDDRMQLFVSDGQNVWSIYKLTADANSAWSNWTSLGSPALGSPSSIFGNTIAVGQLPDFRMQIFIVEHDQINSTLGNIYTMYKLTTDPDSPWSNWTSLGSPGGSYAGDVAIGYLPDDRMQIFICTSDGTVYTMYKLTTDPNSAWSGWTSLGGIGTGIDSVYFAGVSVGNLTDGRMQIFVMGDDGNVYTKWKLTTDASSGWSGWTNLGKPTTGIPSPYSCHIGVGNLPDRRLQIFLFGTDGKIYSMYKLTTDPDSAWSKWTSIGQAGPAYDIAQITYGVAVGYLLFF